ncbi:hypothetical protein SVAN01_07206 [Stagonosporopsis vannaccii]|nr:hypothetical protein SVAN01_07206 [Stagonosporopsis vannaccii]
MRPLREHHATSPAPRQRQVTTKRATRQGRSGDLMSIPGLSSRVVRSASVHMASKRSGLDLEQRPSSVVDKSQAARPALRLVARDHSPAYKYLGVLGVELLVSAPSSMTRRALSRPPQAARSVKARYVEQGRSGAEVDSLVWTVQLLDDPGDVASILRVGLQTGESSAKTTLIIG